jgi:hypothetical protein
VLKGRLEALLILIAVIGMVSAQRSLDFYDAISYPEHHV